MIGRVLARTLIFPDDKIACSIICQIQLGIWAVNILIPIAEQLLSPLTRSQNRAVIGISLDERLLRPSTQGRKILSRVQIIIINVPHQNSGVLPPFFVDVSSTLE